MDPRDPNKQYRFRLRGLFALFCACMLLFFSVLYDAQVIHAQDYYRESASQIPTTQTVEASRGIITDRNGKVLVTNRQVYTMTFDPSLLEEDEDENEAILRLIRLCEERGVTWTDTLPISSSAPYAYTTGETTSTLRSRFQQFLSALGWSDKELTAEDPNPSLTAEAMEDYGLTDADVSALELLNMLRTYYEIPAGLSMGDARKVIGVRYELSLRSLSSTYIPAYVFAEDIDAELISLLNDGDYAGVVVDTDSVREYTTDYAAHILGRVGDIPAGELEAWREQGYRGDELVGIDGVERAFESYLRGTDGERVITTDENGKITGEVYSEEPQPGGTVALTIDIDLQAALEDALAETIQGMIAEDGYEDRGGAAVVIEVGTGEVLAMGSYPTYSLSTYLEDYAENASNTARPFFNRATQGTYPPGSTFKMVTAVAALESGTITPSTRITDRGVYTYYAPSYTPACWVYRSYGTTHGTINVSQALRDSCNYFFYEVGRLTGIDTLNEYGKAFGLGQATGIELPERTGILDGREYRAEAGKAYYGGDLLQIAIGQGDNLFSPLQLANYVATLVDGGTRYAAHLLKSVKTYDNSQVVYTQEPEILSQIEISGSTLEAVKSGMGMVVTGMVASSFRDCVVSAGAKTGSAQTGNSTDNGIFVCFAPFDDPEIAVAVSVERGGSGSALASTAVKIINQYFSTSGTAQTVPEGSLIP